MFLFIKPNSLVYLLFSVSDELRCSACVLIVSVRPCHPLLRQLHWLKARELISRSLSLSTSVSTEQHRRTWPMNLDSQQTSRLDVVCASASSPSLIVRHTRLSTIGDRTFPVAVAPVWNSRPQHVTLHSATSLYVFRSRLKTHLFRRCYLPLIAPTMLFCLRSDTVIVGHINRSSI